MDAKKKGILLFIKHELEFLHVKKEYPDIDIKEYRYLRKLYPNVDGHFFIKNIYRRQRITILKEQLKNPNLPIDDESRLESELRELLHQQTSFRDRGPKKPIVPVLNVRKK